MTDLNFLIKEPVTAMLVKLWSYVPNVAAALVILLVGWVVAKLVSAVVEKLLEIVKVDMAAEKMSAKALSVSSISMSVPGASA